MKNGTSRIIFTLIAFICSFVAEVKSEEKLPDFSRTLLIINYNHPYYDSIEYLRDIYSPTFPHIVFYGEQPHPQVIQNRHHFGWFSHNIIADAMIRWPDFEGYLCVQDDCFMNFWNYGRFDRDKIWLHFNEFHLNLETDETHEWIWWNETCGRASLRKMYSLLPEPYKGTLIQNLGLNCVVGGAADMVYIPGRLKKDFITIAPFFRKVFVELAIPTMLSCLDDRKEWECMKLFWGCGELQPHYFSEFDWLHPIKFSSLENRKYILNVLQKRGLK
jgi:hypothetical protein